jgi:hypothetical protein
MQHALFLALLLSTSPTWAVSEQISSPPAASSPVKARAALQFRIVIPETLQLDPSWQPHGKARVFVSRTVTVENGRSVVTVAKP